jgi:hypothetical protein
MKIGFTSSNVHALVVHGYALVHLTYATCAALAKKVAAELPNWVAAPHGDLSKTGSPNGEDPDEEVFFSFVVGVPVAVVETKAKQASNKRAAAASFNDEAVRQAERHFKEGRAKLDQILAEHGATSNEPGVFLVASGPQASALLEGGKEASVTLLYADDESEEAGNSYTASWDRRPPGLSLGFICFARSLQLNEPPRVENHAAWPCEGETHEKTAYEQNDVQAHPRRAGDAVAGVAGRPSFGRASEERPHRGVCAHRSCLGGWDGVAV